MEKPTNPDDLKTIPLTGSDIQLITFALRKLAESTGFGGTKKEAEELIEYIEGEAKRPD